MAKEKLGVNRRGKVCMSRKEENDKSFIIVRMNEDGITNRRIAANLFLYSIDDEFIRTNVL